MPTAGENPLLGSFAEAGGESRGQRSRSNAGTAIFFLLPGTNSLTYLLIYLHNASDVSSAKPFVVS